MIGEIKKQISGIQKSIDSLKLLLGVSEKEKIMEGLQLKMSEPDFWNDSKSASKFVNELKNAKRDVDTWKTLSERLGELEELYALFDETLEADILKEIKHLQDECSKAELCVLFSGKFDNSNAIIEINSGAGGTEACDWAAMLFRMYFRWAEDKKFKLKVFREERGDEAGVKSITFFIQGLRAYGLLKAERGVHRLVRISPFDSNKRRHTSFASVLVLPEIKEDIEIEIKPDDLRVDTFRSSGAGGQHVNVTDSAVRITYLPLGIVVCCQNERSQHQNRQVALKILKAKLYERKQAESKKELSSEGKDKQKIEWGSQIRSYVLHPYLLVKDHRTNTEIHDAWSVLDGKIDDFIYAFLNAFYLHKKEERK